MAEVIATFPGKIGDAVLQWPVAKLWAKRRGEKIDVGLPIYLKPLYNLFDAQPEVDEVTFIQHIKDRSWKGDPPPYGIADTPFMRWKKQLEMGFRDKPTKEIPLYTAENLCIQTTKEELAEQLFEVEEEERDICVVHGNKWMIHMDKQPRFWSVVPKWDIPHPIVAVGTKDDLEMAENLGWGTFDDHGDLLVTAKLIKSSKLFIGAGSSMSALAFSLGVDAIRVHDDIEGIDTAIYTPLRDNQINLEGDDFPDAWTV